MIIFPFGENINKWLLTFIFWGSFINFSYTQTFSEKEIKQLAKKVNNEIGFTDPRSGLTLSSCYSFGRTLVYQYDVPDNWRATQNMKEDLIANFKELEISEMYFNNEINVDFLYYYGNKLRKKISVKSNEFSNLNFTLGNYVSIKGHPKAKGVDLKIRQPEGWKLEEGNRPNIVKKFTYKTNTFLILIKDYIMFVSRNEAKELWGDEEYVTEFIKGASSYLENAEILNHKIITIDKYPTLEFTFKGNKERAGFNLKMIMKVWVVLYEDKFIMFQSSGLLDKEFYKLEKLYSLIINSIIFPEQYK